MVCMCIYTYKAQLGNFAVQLGNFAILPQICLKLWFIGPKWCIFTSIMLYLDHKCWIWDQNVVIWPNIWG